MLKTAIIGGGFMGVTHTEALRRLNIPVVGMLGADDEETQSFCQRMGIATAYDSLDALLADGEVDVVHLCTPNYLHYPMAKQILQDGKHVLVEKPLATTSEEGKELVEIARQNKVVGAVNFSIRFYPLNQEARASRTARSASRTCCTPNTARTGCSCRPTGTGGWYWKRAAACGWSVISART